jgi:stage II sporulation protein D
MILSSHAAVAADQPSGPPMWLRSIQETIMRRYVAIAIALSMFALGSCALQTRQPEPGAQLLAPIPAYGAAPLIRVKLSKPSESGSLQLQTGKAWVSLDGNRTEFSGKMPLALEGGRVFADGRPADVIEITPMEKPDHFIVDNRVYRGRLRVQAGPGGWEVINVVDLEQYVAGVIGWEMIASWPLEALKAQAVASRTYAMFEMEQARANGRAWDVDDTTMYQVYGGVGPADKPKWWRESANVLAAREQTNGQILTYEGKGIKAFFHSTSGGHTVGPDVGLGINDAIPPLQGVDLGEFGKDSPKHRWEQRLSTDEVNAKLLAAKIRPADIIRIDRSETAPSGHAVKLRLFDRTGHYKIVSAVDVRRALGLFSTNFSAEKLGSEWIFNGRGYGHGCGMCQWSAKGMAAAGWKAEHILETMYPGATLKAIY